MAILPVTLCGANRWLSPFPEEETGSVRDSKCLGWHQGSLGNPNPGLPETSGSLQGTA